MHQMALLEAEVKSLRETNNTLSRRRREKKQRLRRSGAMTLSEGNTQIAQNEAEVQIKQEAQESSGQKPRIESKPRRCGTCGNAGYNARTCQVVILSSNESNCD